ncbi:MAG: hypothetical protein MI924_20725 [Chloroflexales bacterium]|nr:hypothetical protein [Chloroflexales bacterium]
MTVRAPLATYTAQERTHAFVRKAALCFAAGCAGGLANSIVVWLLGALGITAALGVGIAPEFTPAWLYPRIVWGGLWGFLFLLPVLRSTPYMSGLVWSLGPTLVQLLIIFPFKADKGVFGLELGALTPLFVFIFNVIWGLVAAAILVRIDCEESPVS